MAKAPKDKPTQKTKSPIKKETSITETKSGKSIDSTVLPNKQRIQTAAGWQKSMMKKRLERKSAKG